MMIKKWLTILLISSQISSKKCVPKQQTSLLLRSLLFFSLYLSLFPLFYHPSLSLTHFFPLSSQSWSQISLFVKAYLNIFAPILSLSPSLSSTKKCFDFFFSFFFLRNKLRKNRHAWLNRTFFRIEIKFCFDWKIPIVRKKERSTRPWGSQFSGCIHRSIKIFHVKIFLIYFEYFVVFGIEKSPLIFNG